MSFLKAVGHQIAQNPLLFAVTILLAAVLLFGPVMKNFVDVKEAKVGSVVADQRPSAELPLGSDTMGRDILAVMVVGTPLTLRIGLIAGMIQLGCTAFEQCVLLFEQFLDLA